jgi:hypothetical protein
MTRLGDLANKQGCISEAIDFRATARPLFEHSLQSIDVAQIDVWISKVEQTHPKALLRLATLEAPVELVNNEASDVEDRAGRTHQNHQCFSSGYHVTCLLVFFIKQYLFYTMVEYLCIPKSSLST